MDHDAARPLFMARALELARRGLGFVEPNPLVGAVVVREGEIVGEGWHRQFGGPHAEIEALQSAGDKARGSTMYVTLEPCCHQGKTPPCTAAVIQAGVRHVVVAMHDPFGQVSGKGIVELQAAGLDVELGVLEGEVRQLNAPYLKLVTTGRPWVLAKWAMTLDGRIATAAGESRWISGEASRQIVHELRGRMDAVIVGRQTAALDNPLLTARPPGPRTATRIVVDTQASLSLENQLVQTVDAAPVLVAVAENAPDESCRMLAAAGCEVFRCSGDTRDDRLTSLLDELGRRRMANVLVEGGGRLLGSLFDLGQIDEVHAFISPKLVGDADALSPLAGRGVTKIADAIELGHVQVRQLANDVYLTGRLRP